MKIAVITDLHFGGRNDSKVVDDHFRQFYEEVFFPYVDENGIEQIWCLGDTFDRRKYINFQVLDSCVEYFFDQINHRNLKSIFIVGNHDVFYRNSNDVNSPSLLLRGLDNVSIISNEPVEFRDKGFHCIFAPWINNVNYHSVVESLKDTDASYVFGHFEISGFEMYKGVVSHGGMGTEIFKKFEHVFSGHFHRPSTNGNITYIGNPYQFTWGDYPDTKRFMVIDTEQESFTFVENPLRLFYRIRVVEGKLFDERDNSPIEDLSKFKNKYVRLDVESKGNVYEFEKLLDRFQHEGPADLKIVDDVFVALVDNENTQMQSDDTYSVIQNYIDRMEGDFDKVRLKSLILSLYSKTQEMVME